MAFKKVKSKSAQKKKQPAKMNGWSSRKTILLFAALVVGFLLILGVWGLIEAKIVHLQYTELPLEDLPQELDGVTVLFVSDFHLKSEQDARQALDLMDRLAGLQPDVLALGGDYAQIGLMDRLSAGGNAARLEQMEGQRRIWRQILFEGLKDFPATLKLGVAGEQDGEIEALEQDMALGEIKLLANQAVSLIRDEAKLWFVGIEDWSQGDQQYRTLAEQIEARDCVICLSHNPDALPALNNQKGAPWLDAMFSGHTLGGQLTLFGGRALFNPSMYGDRFLSGWHLENRTKLLVSNGLGTGLAPIRFFAPPQVHLVTLRKG